MITVFSPGEETKTQKTQQRQILSGSVSLRSRVKHLFYFHSAFFIKCLTCTKLHLFFFLFHLLHGSNAVEGKYSPSLKESMTRK